MVMRRKKKIINNPSSFTERDVKGMKTPNTVKFDSYFRTFWKENRFIIENMTKPYVQMDTDAISKLWLPNLFALFVQKVEKPELIIPAAGVHLYQDKSIFRLVSWQPQLAALKVQYHPEEGLSGDQFKFDEQGDGPARYRIIHFKQVSPGQYRWELVGEYNGDHLMLNMSKIQFKMGAPAPPSSVCSLPCQDGQARRFLDVNCCWHCYNCSTYQRETSVTRSLAGA
ncbi:Metabotropic glutamate receptor 4 [Amphibalanus amphitrite]|uniref:Metabotropic glutamate receptor 4 n=1 Tax=Amphibalanus amphitrite TaxID=1232801 RepID=A0A6A4X9A9_AMPAM|nr:Metabotropic glutamate receptor 4 [Amphibalanus amphitrite]